jgi:hypothetical protein
MLLEKPVGLDGGEFDKILELMNRKLWMLTTKGASSMK